MISPAEDSQLLNEVLFTTTVLPRDTQAAPTPSAEEKWSRRRPSAPPPARRPTTPYEVTLSESGFDDAAAKDAKIDGEALTVLLHNTGEKGRCS